jgi:hypothetical protein
MSEKLINKNRFLQYELWKDCHIGCKFCCNRGQKDLNKIESLNFILNKMDDEEVHNYNEMGFIGGEFFNGEIDDNEVKKLFYKIFEKCKDLIDKGMIEKIYITTALIYDMDKSLIPFLEYIKELGILDRLLVCTSYDIAYRFHTEERENLWKNNMLKLHNLYPEMQLHTEIIMTQFFIDAVLNDKFSITDFQNTYHTRCDYIEPASGLYFKDKKECAEELPGFFPTKDSYIQFLKKMIQTKEIEFETFLSMELRSSKLYYIDGGKRLIQEDRRSTDGSAKPVDKNIKYEIGLLDSDKSMRELALIISNTMG